MVVGQSWVGIGPLTSVSGGGGCLPPFVDGGGGNALPFMGAGGRPSWILVGLITVH